MNKHLNIIRISPLIADYKGGMEKHILKLTQMQRHLGYRVWLLYSQGQGSNENDIQFLKNYDYYNSPFTNYLRILFYLKILISKKRVKSITDTEIDILHIHGDWIDFFFGLILKLKFHPKILVASIHGDITNHKTFKKYLLIFALKRFDQVFTTGSENFHGLKSNKLKVVYRPSGIDDSFFNLEPPFLNMITDVITVSSLNPRKKVERVLEIAKMLPELNFTVIGDGPQKGKLEKIIGDKSITNVQLIGNIEKDEIPGYLVKSQIFLFTSDVEGTPTAVLEAMAVGLPIVSSNAGGLDAIIKNQINGFILHDYGKIDSYSNYIKYLKDNPEICQTISISNKAQSLHYSWNFAFQDIDQILNQTIQKKLESKQLRRSKYLIRLDDIAPNMNWEFFKIFIGKMKQYNLKAILAVIPDNQSEELLKYPYYEDFWEMIQELYTDGWEIAIHGYNHVYSTKESGILGINNQSEFAGHPYHIQKKKITSAIEIFKSYGITPRSFIAPSHSYDSNTLAVLKELNIQVVSDGFSIYPYNKDNLTFVPQLFANARKMPFGIYTFCYHLNRISEVQFRKLLDFIDQNNRNIISVEEAIRCTRDGIINKNVLPFFTKPVLMSKRLIAREKNE